MAGNYSPAWRDACGVFGVWHPDPDFHSAPGLTYTGLFALQHRGQESAGIAWLNASGMHCIKNPGMVTEVFPVHRRNEMQGFAAIGHVRAQLRENEGAEFSQPLLAHFQAGDLALALNGSLVGHAEIRNRIAQDGGIFLSGSDAETLLTLIALNRRHNPQPEAALAAALSEVSGAYAIVVLAGDRLIGARDPRGIRPIGIGRIGDAWALASESCAIEAAGGTYIRDLEPGEIVTITASGSVSTGQSGLKPSTCLFEYVFFARPDTQFENLMLHEARFESGRILAAESAVPADLVVGVPNSGLSAAQGYALQTGLPYVQGLFRNRYVGRTGQRSDSAAETWTAEEKFIPLTHVLRGQRIVLIDDSIVRGETIRSLTALLRKAQAAEIHLRLASPPVRHPCCFGLDTPETEQLLAHGRSVEEMRRLLDADTLRFLSVAGLRAACGDHGGRLCSACFDGSCASGDST